MDIAILGVGTLGTFLATTFCNDKHDVRVIDPEKDALNSLKKRVDAMSIDANGVFIENLATANVQNADFFIAAGSDDTGNIHACHAANVLGARQVICRLSSERYFDKSLGFPPEKLGINHIVVPQKECAAQIIEAIEQPMALEKITFNIPNVSITAFKALPGSPLLDLKLREFPEKDLISSIRFAAIVRDEKVFAPKGDTIITENDEIYIAGKQNNIDAMMDWATPKDFQKKRNNKMIIIAGCSKTGIAMLPDLVSRGYNVRVIEKDEEIVEELVNKVNSKTIVLHGDPSDGDILEEAGISKTDVFVAMGDDDESNILSCILAKKMGARKVIAITNKEEYAPLIRQMKMIDCDFSRWLVAGNSILRYVSSVNRTHTRAMLHRTEAFVSEFIVKQKSPLIGKKIDQCGFPEDIVLSIIFRDGDAFIPSGNLIIEANDIVTAITTHTSEQRLVKLFG